MCTETIVQSTCIECGGTGQLTRLGGDWGQTSETAVPCWRCTASTKNVIGANRTQPDSVPAVAANAPKTRDDAPQTQNAADRVVPAANDENATDGRFAGRDSVSATPGMTAVPAVPSSRKNTLHTNKILTLDQTQYHAADCEIGRDGMADSAIMCETSKRRFYIKFSGSAWAIQAKTPEDAIDQIRKCLDYSFFDVKEIGKDCDELGYAK